MHGETDGRYLRDLADEPGSDLTSRTAPTELAALAACVFVLAGWMPAALSEVKAPQAQGTQQLAAIVNRALEANAEIQAARTAVQAARARLRGAGFPLNNPDLEIMTEQKEDREDSKYMLGFSKTMDWHDKRSTLEQSARAELGAVQAQLAELKLTKARVLGLQVR